ncbi:hypothetical protein [Paraburkholderia solisilvae]|nr:hypothetical protein [Paraburkholderia solisilvae]
MVRRAAWSVWSMGLAAALLWVGPAHPAQAREPIVRLALAGNASTSHRLTRHDGGRQQWMPAKACIGDGRWPKEVE